MLQNELKTIAKKRSVAASNLLSSQLCKKPLVTFIRIFEKFSTRKVEKCIDKVHNRKNIEAKPKYSREKIEIPTDECRLWKKVKNSATNCAPLD